MGWFLGRKNFATPVSRVRDLARFPELVWLDRYDFVAPVILRLQPVRTWRTARALVSGNQWLADARLGICPIDRVADARYLHGEFALASNRQTSLCDC